MAEHAAGPGGEIVPRADLSRLERDAQRRPVDEIVRHRVPDASAKMPIFGIREITGRAEVEQVKRLAELARREPEIPEVVVGGDEHQSSQLQAASFEPRAVRDSLPKTTEGARHAV